MALEVVHFSKFYGLKSLKLFMVMKVVLIIMAAVSRVLGLTLLDPQTSFTRKSSVRGVLWLSRIDQEGFSVVRILNIKEQQQKVIDRVLGSSIVRVCDKV
ncbi:hypothetical protein Tco_0453115 [Tanacetum coccineum]